MPFNSPLISPSQDMEIYFFIDRVIRLSSIFCQSNLPDIPFFCIAFSSSIFFRCSSYPGNRRSKLKNSSSRKRLITFTREKSSALAFSRSKSTGTLSTSVASRLEKYACTLSFSSFLRIPSLISGRFLYIFSSVPYFWRSSAAVFSPTPLNARQIVRRIAAQAFVIVHLVGLEAISLKNRFFVIENRVAHPAPQSKNFCLIVHELQAYRDRR